MFRSVCIVIGLAVLTHSARGGLDPWLTAHDQVAASHWADAAESYQKLRSTTRKGSEDYQRATFALAVSLQHQQPASRESILQATTLYHELIDAPASPAVVARSMMNLGRIAELIDYPGDVPDLDAARAFYRDVMSRWPNEPIGSEAALRAGGSLVIAFDSPQFFKVRAGLQLIQSWLRDHPDNAYAAIMWQYCGDGYFHPLDDPADAMRCYQQVDRMGWPDAGNQGAVLWKCSQLAQRDLNDSALAVHFYTEILTDTPGNANAYKALVALRRLNAPLPPIPQSLRDSNPPTTQEAR